VNSRDMIFDEMASWSWKENSSQSSKVLELADSKAPLESTVIPNNIHPCKIK